LMVAIIGRILEFISRLRQDDDPHGPSRRSTRASTCS
jgi:hypothetical protein